MYNLMENSIINYYYYFIIIWDEQIQALAEARSGNKSGWFWSRGVTALFDVRVTQTLNKSGSKQRKPTSKISRDHENEKKRQYLQERWKSKMEILRLLCLKRMVEMNGSPMHFIPKNISGEKWRVIRHRYSLAANTLIFWNITTLHLCVKVSRECHLGNGMKERCWRIFK